ncbi:efflux RND transporter periplasmic adaptor subunit [Chitinophagaceae bacterium 26-R-25]|nr:efflux RND transporter periplasmic adaptor subunit [Chitinophagaceae bacterium 26-R-25]
MIQQCSKIAIICFAIFLTACNSKKQPTNTSNAVKTLPVTVLTEQPATIATDYPANIQGVQNIEIRPKIDGYVESIAVDEGSSVKKRQLLFQIMAPQYEQNVRTAEANIKIATAEVQSAQMQVNKVRPLVDKDIVSGYELESAKYLLESKLAALAQAEAALNNAKTNLSYTKIYSPADGVIGLLPYKIGSLVSSTTPPLTTVSDIRKVYAYFSFDEKHGLDFFQAVRGGTMQEKLATLPPVTLVLANGYVMPEKGRVETASGIINTQTGSVNMRATFDNPQLLIRSGSSAIVRIPQSIPNAIMVPQKATYQIQGKLFVYVVGSNETVSSSEITIAGQTRDAYIVKSGVKKGDMIVADGINSLREGLEIKPLVVASESLYPKDSLQNF